MIGVVVGGGGAVAGGGGAAITAAGSEGVATGTGELGSDDACGKTIFACGKITFACAKGSTGADTGATAIAGTIGGATRASCGTGPATFTCNCSVVPGGRVCGNCALTITSPTLSAVRPSGVFPSTTASSTCPGLNSDGSAAAGRSAGL
ncbi:MAG: hypothetical protein ABIQ30_00515 [Devosia sp.]